MVRYLNATVNIYVKTSTRNDEGTRISSYGYLTTPKVAANETIRCDVQPYKLTEAEMTLYGIDDDGADTRKMFYNSAVYVKTGNRAEVTSDYDGTKKYFDIMPINLWEHHGEVLLVPVAGE